MMGMRNRQENEGLLSYLYCVAGGSLVPGDVLVLPPSGFILSCDTALTTGHAIVEASVLYSIQVNKKFKKGEYRDHQHA